MSRPPTALASRANPRHPRRRSSRGVTLLELLIGVGVIIVITVGVLMGVRSLNGQLDRSALLRHAPQIHANLSAYGVLDAATAKDLTTKAAIDLNAFPLDLVSGESVGNAFGGQTFVTGLKAPLQGIAAGGAYVLSFTGIPASQCASVARGLSALADGVWVKASTTTDQPTALPDGSGMVREVGKPLDRTKLTTQCADGGGPLEIHVLMKR